jgi:ribonucleoside-diphosphate reductase alpha chain
MSNLFHTRLDPVHRDFNPFDHEFTQHIWEEKYRAPDDITIQDTFWRVAEAVSLHNDPLAKEFADAMSAGLWMPGGRIIAGAGTSKRVTLMNCYVNKKLEDSLDDIMAGVSIAALTQQQGGGIGTDFSTLRPSGAILRRTGAVASGPLPFMDMWHSMCATIMSAGARRGAMMGTMSDTHPDLLNFVKAKQEAGRLTNFNVSVLVSDAFMEAVREDAEWLLYFPVEPKVRAKGLKERDFKDDEQVLQYVYSIHQARDLWETITRNTYEFSEPGVIFIDRINDANNLKYCEDIHCTNPCGEQPLPPNGTCNLGAINLARLVKRPFSTTAEFDFELLGDIASLGMKFLDNVIEVTNYPIPEQQEEEFNKRRTGLGVSGLADCLAMLGLRYGSQKAVEITEKIFYTICQEAYRTSVQLAKVHGAFPMFDADEYLNETFAGTHCDHAIVADIRKNGIRNGVLLTVAPTGTTSILYGDISSGIEPTFAFEMDRNVRQPDGVTYKSFKTSNYAFRVFKSLFPETPTPAHMVTIEDLTINDHVAMQAAVQRWVDASVSKTVNVPKETTYEQFLQVYELAYQFGCKGCTTYRPSDIRGSIITKAGDKSKPTDVSGLAIRPDTLTGRTRRIKWPTLNASLYLTVNYLDGIPHEVFFNSKDSRLHDWMVATSLMITSILRRGGEVGFIARELQQVQSLHDTAFVRGPHDENPRNYQSLIALVGAHLGDLLTAAESSTLITSPTIALASVKEKCPSCGGLTIIRKEGCMECSSCGYSDCG